MLNLISEKTPFSLFPFETSDGLRDRLVRKLAKPFSRLSGLDHCAELYAGLPLRRRVSDFAENALARLGVGWSVDTETLQAVPQKGATIIVANHPFGGLEGLVLLAILRRIRPDVKVLANHMLCRIPEMREYVIPVDPFNTSAARKRNVSPLRKAFEWLKQDGLIVVFPAGEVAHFQLKTGQVTDPEWQPGVGRLIQKSGATVVPVFFDGRNGLAFQLAGLLHPRLRTFLLPRQLLNKEGLILDVKIGAAIPSGRFKAFTKAEELTEYLRLRTYLLAGEGEGAAVSPAGAPCASAMLPLAEPAPRAELEIEINRLPESCLMHEQGEFQVWCIRATDGPLLLREIGLLRELTFRQHDEGTGRGLDLDWFDEFYQHLFVWNKKEREIVGAYRIGLSDDILLEHGLSGLYTNTLFRYREELFEKLGPALELGRSFVRPEYQKSFSPLLLLWQGIGRFLVRNPRYRYLFGPVSISQTYSDFSRQLMTSTLNEQFMVPDLARFVAPRLPVVVRKPKVTGCATQLTGSLSSTLERVDNLLADIEADGKGLPVLLRHYLALGGRMLAFNLDPAFNNVIDGLILVDLEKTPCRNLTRYMGKDGLVTFSTFNNGISESYQKAVNS